MPTGLVGGTGSARWLLGLLPLQAEDFPLDHRKDERVDVTQALMGNGTSIGTRQKRDYPVLLRGIVETEPLGFLIVFEAFHQLDALV